MGASQRRPGRLAQRWWASTLWSSFVVRTSWVILGERDQAESLGWAHHPPAATPVPIRPPPALGLLPIPAIATAFARNICGDFPAGPERASGGINIIWSGSDGRRGKGRFAQGLRRSLPQSGLRQRLWQWGWIGSRNKGGERLMGDCVAAGG